MDDFLHNLRSGKLKQQDRGRRDYSDYKGPQRRSTTERRRPDYYAKVTNENFVLVKNSLDNLAEIQKRIADAAVDREKTEARIADALETIATMMERQWSGQGHLPQHSENAGAEPEANVRDSIVPVEVVDTHTDVVARDEKFSSKDKHKRMDIITAMRMEGKSWEKIARHLDGQNIPTVSGKGKWRGQAVKKFWDANTDPTGS